MEYMFREVCAPILPANGIVKPLADWRNIAKKLAESKRKRRWFFLAPPIPGESV